MDETTEPIIAVIGNPIAGNPTQFALETGLESVSIDCRVFSLSLNDEQIRNAVVGMGAMRFEGVWVAPSCRDAVARWLGESGRSGERIDFLKFDEGADPKSPWEPYALQSQVWPTLASDILAGDRKTASPKVASKREFNRVIFVGDYSPEQPDGIAIDQAGWSDRLKKTKKTVFQNLTVDSIEFRHDLPSSSTLLKMQSESSENEFTLVVLGVDSRRSGETKPVALPDQALPERTVMIDLCERSDPAELAAADRLKSSSENRFIRGVDVHAKCLSEVIRLLFDHTVSIEILQDAIDEYLAV